MQPLGTSLVFRILQEIPSVIPLGWLVFFSRKEFLTPGISSVVPCLISPNFPFQLFSEVSSGILPEILPVMGINKANHF